MSSAVESASTFSAPAVSVPVVVIDAVVFCVTIVIAMPAPAVEPVASPVASTLSMSLCALMFSAPPELDVALPAIVEVASLPTISVTTAASTLPGSSSESVGLCRTSTRTMCESLDSVTVLPAPLACSDDAPSTMTSPVESVWMMTTMSGSTKTSSVERPSSRTLPPVEVTELPEILTEPFELEITSAA